MVKNFKESYDTAVFTTRFVLEKKSPILFVFHFSDDSWQFSGPEENLSDNDFKLVSLKEIVALDNSILEVAHIPLGSEAKRINHESSWRVNKEN